MCIMKFIEDELCTKSIYEYFKKFLTFCTYVYHIKFYTFTKTAL